MVVGSSPTVGVFHDLSAVRERFLPCVGKGYSVRSPLAQGKAATRNLLHRQPDARLLRSAGRGCPPPRQPRHRGVPSSFCFTSAQEHEPRNYGCELEVHCCCVLLSTEYFAACAAGDSRLRLRPLCSPHKLQREATTAYSLVVTWGGAYLERPTIRNRLAESELLL